MLKAFGILKGWQGKADDWALRDWVGVDRDFVTALYHALGPDRCAAIASRFLTDPYAYSKGWPDLIWVEDGRVGLIEVKTTDRLHRSQIVTIPEMTAVAGTPVGVVCVREHRQSEDVQGLE